MTGLESRCGVLCATAGPILAGTVVVALRGELDVYTRPILLGRATALIAAGATVLILDMRHVSFADSVGLGVLVNIHKQAAAVGGGVVLAGLREFDRKTLAITGLDRVFLAVRDSLEEAHAALSMPEAA